MRTSSAVIKWCMLLGAPKVSQDESASFVGVLLDDKVALSDLGWFSIV